VADPDLQYFGSAFEWKTRSGSSLKLMEAWSVCIPVTADPSLWWGTGSGSWSNFTGIRADPDPDQTLKLQKVTFYLKNILWVGKMSKTYLRRYTKSFWKAGNRVYLLIFVNFRIRITNTDSQINAEQDPQYGTVCNPDSRFFRSISRVQYLRSRPSLKALSLVSSTAILDLSTAVTLTFSWFP
jgi:hypothetical protein